MTAALAEAAVRTASHDFRADMIAAALVIAALCVTVGLLRRAKKKRA